MSHEECDSLSLLGGYTDAFLVEDKIRRIVEGDTGQSVIGQTKNDCIAKNASVYPEHEKVTNAKDMCVAPHSRFMVDEGQSSMKRLPKSSHVPPRDLVDQEDEKEKRVQDTGIAPASTVGEADLVDESQTIQSILDRVKARKSSTKQKKPRKRRKKEKKHAKPKGSVDLTNMKEEPKEKPEKEPKKKQKEKPEEDMSIAPTSTVGKTVPRRNKNASGATVKPNKNIALTDKEGCVTSAVVCEIFENKFGERKVNSENLKKYFVADELHAIATFSRGFPVPKTWSKNKLIDCILQMYSYGGSRLHLALLSGTNFTENTTGGILSGTKFTENTTGDAMLESGSLKGADCFTSESGLPQPSCAVQPSQIDNNYEKGWSDCPSPFYGTTVQLRDVLLAESNVSARHRPYAEI